MIYSKCGSVVATGGPKQQLHVASNIADLILWITPFGGPAGARVYRGKKFNIDDQLMQTIVRTGVALIIHLLFTNAGRHNK